MDCVNKLVTPTHPCCKSSPVSNTFLCVAAWEPSQGAVPGKSLGIKHWAGQIRIWGPIVSCTQCDSLAMHQRGGPEPRALVGTVTSSLRACCRRLGEADSCQDIQGCWREKTVERLRASLCRIRVSAQIQTHEKTRKHTLNNGTEQNMETWWTKPRHVDYAKAMLS